MINRKDSLRSIIELAFAWIVLPLAYFAWCFSTLVYKGAIFASLAAVTGVMAAVFYALAEKMIIKRYKTLSNQFIIIDYLVIAMGLILTVAFLRGGIADYLYVLFIIATWIIVAIFNLYQNKIDITSLRVIINHVSKRRYLFVLILLVMLLSYDENLYQFKWDGLLYYHAVKEANITSISSVALYGHISQTCGVLFKLMAMMVSNTGYGMAIANLLVLLIGMISFYLIMEELVPGKSDMDYSLSTACFVFSPYLLGMVNYYSIDYACVCLSALLIVYVVKKKWVLFLPSSILFCFTKEPALIAYCGLCLGLVIVDLVTSKGKFREKICYLLESVRYYYMITPVLLWIFTYKMLGGWSAGNGGFALDFGYIVEKLKLFLFFNFSWICVVVIGSGLVYLVIKKRLKDEVWWIVPLIISNICLLLFNCLFATVNHPRYIDSFITVNLVLSMGILLKLCNGYKCRILSGVIALVMLLSCYISFDPVSNLLFDVTDVGESKLYTTNRMRSGDSAIYNKQILWMEKAMDMAIEEAINDDTLIVFPIVNNSVYEFDGMSEAINLVDKIEYDNQFWNKAKKERVSYEDENLYDDEVDSIRVCHLNVEDDDRTIPDEDKISVICVAGINNYSSIEGYHIECSYEYEYRGWVVTRNLLVKD